jgi:hypothetical protein
MLSSFERAMATLSLMLVKARAPIDVSNDEPTPEPVRDPRSRIRHFHAFDDVSANTPTLSRTWRQLGDWLSGRKVS